MHSHAILIEEKEDSPSDKWGTGSTVVLETPPSTPSDNTQPKDTAEGDQEESNDDESKHYFGTVTTPNLMYTII